MWKYDKAFLDYVYKTAEMYIQYNPLNTKRQKKVFEHYRSYIWFVMIDSPLMRKPRRWNPFGMSIPEMIKDKDRMKEILQIALDNKNKTNVLS